MEAAAVILHAEYESAGLLAQRVEKNTDEPEDRRRVKRLRDIGLRGTQQVEFEPTKRGVPFVERQKEAGMNEGRSDRLVGGGGNPRRHHDGGRVRPDRCGHAGLGLEPIGDRVRVQRRRHEREAGDRRPADRPGSVLFLPFVSYVRSLLDGTGGAAGLLPSAAFAGGILLVAGLFTGAVLSSAMSAGATSTATAWTPT